MAFGLAEELSSTEQEYNPTPLINEIRGYVETWRNLPNPDQWQVTPETARLLRHWRHHPFQGVRPFFCQVEAVETAIWLTEVAPKMGVRGAKFWKHLEGANEQANPELIRMALKLATVSVHGMQELLDPRWDSGWLRDIEKELAWDMRPAPKFHKIVDNDIGGSPRPQFLVTI